MNIKKLSIICLLGLSFTLPHNAKSFGITEMLFGVVDSITQGFTGTTIVYSRADTIALKNGASEYLASGYMTPSYQGALEGFLQDYSDHHGHDLDVDVEDLKKTEVDSLSRLIIKAKFQ